MRCSCTAFSIKSGFRFIGLWAGAAGIYRSCTRKAAPEYATISEGVPISDDLGKVVSSVLYDPVDVTQCGAVKRKSGDLATHFLWTMMVMASACSLSIVILFIDLAKAFDRVLREIVIGWPQSGADDGVQYFIDLASSRDHAKDLAKEIGAGSVLDGSVLDDVKVHPHATALLASMHAGSRFSVADNSEALVVRQFGGVLLNLAHSKAFERLYARACEETNSIYEPGVAPRTNPSSTPNDNDTHRVT